MPIPQVFIAQKPELPVTQTLTFVSDVLKADDGTEQRIAAQRNPVWSIEQTYHLPTRHDVRLAQETTYSRLADFLYLPLWWEVCQLTQAAVTSTTTLHLALGQTDIFPGDMIFLQDQHDETLGTLIQVATVDTMTNTLTLAVPLDKDFPAGAWVYVVVECRAAASQSLDFWVVQGGTLRLTATTTTPRRLQGHGGTVDTYRGLPLLRRQQLLLAPQGTATYDARLTIIQQAGITQVIERQARPDIVRPRAFKIPNKARLQDYKAFFERVVGQREPFYVPSYLGDLYRPTAVPGSAFLLTETDVATIWFGSTAHRDLVIEGHDGTVQFAHIEAIVDNLDGTFTLTLDSVFDVSYLGVRRAGWFELCRLAEDTVTFTHYGLHSIVQFTTRSVEDTGEALALGASPQNADVPVIDDTFLGPTLVL